jgi:hypothetical protein
MYESHGGMSKAMAMSKRVEETHFPQTDILRVRVVGVWSLDEGRV